MRTTRPVGLSLALALLLPAIPQTADAQLGGVLGRKAKQAVERKAEAKVDRKIDEMAGKMVDRSFESIFGGPGEAAAEGNAGGSGGASGGRAGAGMFAMMPGAPTEERYAFDLVISYDLTQTERGKRAERVGTMMAHFNRTAPYTGTRILPVNAKKDDGEAFIIFDAKHEAMVMLMTSKDGKFSSAYGWKDAKAFADAAATDRTAGAEESQEMRFERIGTKTIAGHQAEGYRTTSDDGTSEIWVSRDAALSSARMLGANASMKQMRGVMPGGHPIGALLEITTVSKDGDTMLVRATTVDAGANVRIEMAEYPRLGAGR